MSFADSLAEGLADENVPYEVAKILAKEFISSIKSKVTVSIG